MMVHTLELADVAQLGPAFETVLGAEGLSECAIEIDSLRIRFVAPDERAASVIREIALTGVLRTAAREWVDTAMVVGAGIHGGSKAR